MSFWGHRKASSVFYSALNRHMVYKSVRHTYSTYCQCSKHMNQPPFSSTQKYFINSSYNSSQIILLRKVNKPCLHLNNQYRYKNNETKNTESVLDKAIAKKVFIFYGYYASFFVFVGLLSAAILYHKKQYLASLGIHKLNIPIWGNMQLYQYKDYVIPYFAINQVDDVIDFKTTKDDIWVVSFPRSGITWLQEIVYLIYNNVNLWEANNILLDERFPYLEFMYPEAKFVAKRPSPRLIRSHLPLSLLPKSVHEQKPKIIYIARNPKDVFVSAYFFVRMLHPVIKYKMNMEEFFDLFMQDKVMYSPWSNHVKEFWDNKDQDNILFITYEDLIKDTSVMIDKISTFLGKRLTETAIQTIVQHTRFEQMKSNIATNHVVLFTSMGISDPRDTNFMRKGCVGDWTNHLTPEMSTALDHMVNKTFSDTDLHFQYHVTLNTEGSPITQGSPIVTVDNSDDKNNIPEHIPQKDLDLNQSDDKPLSDLDLSFKDRSTVDTDKSFNANSVKSPS